jgi:hypothetical protein
MRTQIARKNSHSFRNMAGTVAFMINVMRPNIFRSHRFDLEDYLVAISDTVPDDGAPNGGKRDAPGSKARLFKQKIITFVRDQERL